MPGIDADSSSDGRAAAEACEEPPPDGGLTCAGFALALARADGALRHIAPEVVYDGGTPIGDRHA